MRLYYHVDHGHRLNVGEVICKERYFNQSPMVIFTPFMDDEFVRHLDKICKDGLSLHGAQYLIQTLSSNVHMASFFIELYYEYIRYKYYDNRPSRLQSLFAFRKYKQALEFAKSADKKGKIFEISFEGKYSVGDMNLLKLDLDPQKQENYARQYWEEKPFSTDVDYIANWEYIIDLPVTVVKEVLVNPLEL